MGKTESKFRAKEFKFSRKGLAMHIRVTRLMTPTILRKQVGQIMRDSLKAIKPYLTRP